MHYSHLLRRATTTSSGRCASNRVTLSLPAAPAAPAARSYHAASVLPSLVSTSSPEFRARAGAMDQLVADLEAKLTAARAGGGAKAAERMRSKRKMLPRERCATASCLSPYPPSQQPADDRVLARPLRLAQLLDPHSPFLELSPLAAHDVYPGESVPGAGLVTGIGRISGRECVVVVNDATVKGGSYYPLTVSVPFATYVFVRFNPCENAGVGEEAFACSGDRERARFALCVSWCVAPSRHTSCSPSQLVLSSRIWRCCSPTSSECMCAHLLRIPFPCVLTYITHLGVSRQGTLRTNILQHGMFRIVIGFRVWPHNDNVPTGADVRARDSPNRHRPRHLRRRRRLRSRHGGRKRHRPRTRAHFPRRSTAREGRDRRRRRRGDARRWADAFERERRHGPPGARRRARHRHCA